MGEKNKLIIFDMDNTLIHSHIDFALMKSESCRLLREAGLQPHESIPVAQMLSSYKMQGLLPTELEERIWQAIAEIEYAGLAEATVEPHIELVLEQLAPQAHMVVLTNTDQQAANDRLKLLSLAPWFERIMGRGDAPDLKPAPGGMLALLAAYPHLKAANTLAVGDAAIDICAARAAGLHFCAYNRSRAENWQKTGLAPQCQLSCWDDGSTAAMLAILEG